jgi:hypothetical protein
LSGKISDKYNIIENRCSYIILLKTDAVFGLHISKKTTVEIPIIE